jgi:hypothetical protein
MAKNRSFPVVFLIPKAILLIRRGTVTAEVDNGGRHTLETRAENDSTS